MVRKTKNRERLKSPATQEINALSTLFAERRYPEAAALAQRMTELYPQHEFAWTMLGASLSYMGRRVDAFFPFQKAVELSPDNADFHFNLGSQLHDTNRLTEAEAAYRRALKLKPNFAEVYNNFGNLLKETQRLSEAEAAFRRALDLKPNFAEANYNLGNTLRDLGRREEAEASYRRALGFKPDFADAHFNLGNALMVQDRRDEAESSYRRALQIQPDYAEAYNNLANILGDQGRLDEAIANYRRALQIQPDYAEAHLNLGNILWRLGRLDEAEASCCRTIELKPDYAEAHLNLGNILKDLGRLNEAEASYRRALQIKPDYADAHSNLIFTLDMSASEDVASLQAERKAWGERHAASLYQQQRAFSNSLDPERLLRIGYVSADFREHSAARAFEGMLFYFDRQQYEIYAYSNNALDEAVTQRFKQSVTVWRNIAGQSDAAVAELIGQDEIDILVDLSGHTAGNRLLVFARKPAPIQITAWGHATGTGVKAIDVFFADAVIVPPEERSLYAETVRYLPCALCYSSDAVPPPVNALPALQQPAITFGSFNRLCKVTDATIALWSRVLQATPDSSIFLKTPELGDAATRSYVTSRLERAGIEAKRIEMQGKTSWEKHMAAFNRIDIALDPFPQGGGITTLEGLLMGIPAITLRWPTIAGRISATILTTLGLTDWIAETEDAYVALAVGKARDREALAALRGTLRERFKRSVLGDAKAYVRIVEAQYRELWRAWVQKQSKHNTRATMVSDAPTDCDTS